jgi:hypothetical protein
MPGFNWPSVDGFGVLLIECKGCGRRAALGKEDVGTRMHKRSNAAAV